MICRQFVEETRWNSCLPKAVNAPVGCKGDFRAALGAGEPDIGETALLFEPGPPPIVKRALMREKPLLPARQKNGFEFKPLCRMQGHDRNPVARLRICRIHDQRDMFKESAKIWKLLHRAD